MRIKVGRTQLELVEGDIAEQETDAIVNAAHPDLMGGTGVDGVIQWRGGPRILEECRKIGGCPVGDAVITTGGDLRAPYVIHAVGPVYDEGDEEEAYLLACAYQNSLKRAEENGLRSIAFPSISTGAFCYPIREAAPVALKALLDFLQTEDHHLELVRLVLYPREDPAAYSVYASALSDLIET